MWCVDVKFQPWCVSRTKAVQNEVKRLKNKSSRNVHELREINTGRQRNKSPFRRRRVEDHQSMAVENRRGRAIPSMRPRDETRGAANAGTRPGNTLYRIDWWQEGRE